MPRTELVFFDGWEASKNGLARGFIAFVPLCVSLSIYHKVNVDIPTRLSYILIVSLVLCSAIGVQLATTTRESVYYGLLVGACVSILTVCYKEMITNCGKTLPSSIKYVIFLTLLTTITSLITHKVSKALL